jgi:hypothetical protein
MLERGQAVRPQLINQGFDGRLWRAVAAPLVQLGRAALKRDTVIEQPANPQSVCIFMLALSGALGSNAPRMLPPVERCPLRGHDRQSVSLTVCLVIPGWENAKDKMTKGVLYQEISQELQRLESRLLTGSPVEKNAQAAVFVGGVIAYPLCHCYFSYFLVYRQV